MAFSRVAVKYGLIAGIGTVAYFLLFYFLHTEWLFNPFVYWVSLGFYMALMWRALQEEEQNSGQLLEFREALQSAFLVFVLANFIYYVFYYLLYGLIDPSLIDLQREVMKASLEQAGGALDEEQKEELLESIKGDQLIPTPGTVFFTFVRSLIGGFILAAGMAAVKSRR